MRRMILATAAILSLGAGSVYAASNGQDSNAPNNYSQPAYSQPAQVGTADPAANDPQTGGMSNANPWQGTESWDQWNKDHPIESGD